MHNISTTTYTYMNIYFFYGFCIDKEQKAFSKKEYTNFFPLIVSKPELKLFNFYLIINHTKKASEYGCYILIYKYTIIIYIYIFFSGYPQDQRQSYGIKVEQESFKSHKHA